MINDTIAILYQDLTDFQLWEELTWLQEDAPSTSLNARQARAILQELAIRSERRKAIEDLLY